MAAVGGGGAGGREVSKQLVPKGIIPNQRYSPEVEKKKNKKGKRTDFVSW